MSCKQTMLFVAVVAFSTSGIAEAGLVAYWNLNDTAADTNVPDSVGSFNGALVTANGGTLPTKGEQGVIGNAYHFYGTSNQGSGAIIPSDPYNGLTQGTFSAWYKLNGTTGSWQPRFAQTSSNGFLAGLGSLDSEPNRAYAYVVGNSDTLFVELNAAPSPSAANVWHQLTVAFNATTETLYIDGIARGTHTVSNLGGPQAASRMGISGETVSATAITNDHSLPGLMDDIGILNQSLNAAQVKASYNMPLFAPLGAASNGHYGLNDMLTLFNLFTTGSGTASVGSLTWQNVSSLTGHNAGDVWDNGNGTYFLQLDASGNGLSTVSIPEPTSMTLIAIGFSAIVCAGRRKRSC